jgi:cytidylate kinase
MTVSAISHYRGGTLDVVTPVAKRLKAAYLKHGVTYRLSQFQTGPNVGDWFVVVTCDQAAQEKAQAAIAKDPECQQIFAEIAKFATRISQETVLDLDLDAAD